MSILSQFKRILVLAPHTDDAEIGSGATLARISRESTAEVRIVAFSSADQSVPEGLPRDINRHDSLAAALHLGVPNSSVRILDYQVREFGQHRQEILEEMISIRSSFEPDLIIGPSSFDVHQDHATINQEMVRAFGKQTVLGQEFPWNCKTFVASCHVEVSEQDVRSKVLAVLEYRSQRGRTYSSEDFLRAWALFRGCQNKLEFAEAYEMIHWKA